MPATKLTAAEQIRLNIYIMRALLLALMLTLIAGPTWGQTSHEVAFNIITYQPLGFRVDDTPQGVRVKRLLTRLHDLGTTTVIFNFSAKMIGGTSSEIWPDVPPELQAQEEALLKQTIAFAKSVGLQVAFRPIMLVVGPHGEFPWVENGFTWWHGNIRPQNIPEWFDHFFSYHQRYMRIAGEVKAQWYSIGAEMHSMTSGLGSREPTWRLGYPEHWVDFVTKARALLGPNVQITYGANYTDQYVLENGIKTWGGEFEQWHHDLTFQAVTPEEIKHQDNMRKLWRSLDFIGLDYYRALGSANADYPQDYNALVDMLNIMSNIHSQSIDAVILDIDAVVGTRSKLALQEVGYRSVEKCFVSPYLYEDDHTPINYMHQAAAWDALLRALWTPNWSWMRGVGIWQVLLDDDSDQTINGGFSPLGKSPTETVMRKYFEGPAPQK